MVLHSFSGSDRWWNLDPKLTAIHREKSKVDTGIVAKTKRVSTKWEEFMRKMSKPKKAKVQEKKIVRRCRQCGYKVRSVNPVYVKVRMERHKAAAHP